MTVVEGIEHRLGRGVAGKTVPLATLLHRQERLAVIGLEHQQVIGTPIEDLAGDRLLAAHGIQRHDAVLQGQRLEQRRDRGDLVRLAVDLTLAKRQALLAGPGTDQVQRPLGPAAVEGSAQGLAVDRHDFRGCPGRCCKWMGVAQVDNYAASPRLARLEWSARVVARAAFRASRASLSFGNCL